MKKNFFSARKVTCIDDVWRSLPGWLERKNQRIHRSTLRVPKAVYDSIERSAMRPLLPSVYETSPNTFRTYEIAAMPYVLYKSCRYSVPRDYAFKTVRFKVVSGKIHIYDDQLNYICSHNLSERKGSVNQLPDCLLYTSITRMNEWRQLIHERQQSGLSVRAWCQQNGIRENSYYYWLRIIREEALCEAENKNGALVSM